MPRHRFLFAFVVLTSVLVSTPLPCLSQSQGVPWYTIPLPVPGGFVDAATGNLHLEIPIASVPERNGDPLVSKLIYDTPLYAYNYNISGFSGGPGWRVFTGTSHSGTGFMASNTTQACPPGYTGNIYIYSAPSFTDSHGTTHSNNNQNLYTKQVQCYSNGIPYGSQDDITSFSAVASDGSGYSFNVSNYTNLKIFSPDGWLVYDSTGDAQSSEYPVDTNGNYASYAEGSQPDMLGRSPFQVGFHQCSRGSGTSTVRVSDGSTNTYTFTCTTYSLAEVISGTQYTGTASFLTNVALPDGTQYSFSYDTGTTGTHLGGLLSVTLPASGVISFTYVGVTGGSSLPYRVGTAAFAGGTWNLSYAYNTSTGVTTTTVTSPLRHDSASNTNVTDQAIFTSVAFNPYIQTAQYYSGSSTLLRTVSTTYDSNGNFLPMTVTTALNDTGQSSSVSYQYYNLMRDYPTQKQETDFGGSVVRMTVTNYYGAFMKPQSINVYVGSNTTGTPVSSTLYSIDEYSANYCKNGVPMLTNVSGATGHDANYGTSFTARGNVTTIQRLISGTTYATTHMCYDTLGNVTQTVDANGNPTSFDYSESWADTYCIPSGTITHAFPTTITDALGHQTKNSYFTCTSLRQSLKDANDIQANRGGTTFTYDLFNRPITVNYPDLGQTTYCYSHDPNSSCYTNALPPFSTESRLMSGSTTLNTKTFLDAYNRVVETNLTSDPDCASGDKTDTTYDNFGRVLTVSNPYCSNSDPTYGLTTYAYDALGRTTQVTEADASPVTTSYTGNCTTVTDEASKRRQSCSDGVGRLTQVTEDPGSSPHLNYATNYTYDALDNLLTVVQNGSRQRSFNYDSLSRLLCASNPENSSAACPAAATSTYTPGTTGYTYDANGNLSTRTAPAPNPNPPSPTVTTTYTYDALNRPINKNYSDANSAAPTSPVTFQYDQASSWTPISNPIGRLTTICAGAGSTITCAEYSYDPMGRTVLYAQCHPSNCGSSNYSTAFTYDLAGNMLSASNPVGYTISYTYDTASRPAQVTSNFVDSQHPTQHPANLATVDPNVGYWPNGALRKVKLGNGLYDTAAYNKRLQPCRMNTNSTSTFTLTQCTDGAPSGNVLDFTYGYNNGANNGDIASWSATGQQAFNRTCTYDSLNRIATMADSNTGQACKGLSWNIDPWGNLTNQNVTQGSCPTFQSSANTKNQLTGAGSVNYQYDAAGNMTYDGPHTYYYDAENRLIQVDGTLGTCSSAMVCYVYDWKGVRVRSTEQTGASEWIHDVQGNVVSQFIINFGFGRGYVYLGSQQLAEYGDGTTYFIHRDHLSSTRLVTKPDGSIQDSYDYLPFGQITSGPPGGHSILHLFTGKEHDAETATGFEAQDGFDYFGARYYASRMFRFMTPDPENAGADEGNPQRWNAYSYVGNDPLNAVDPDGRQDCHEVSDADGGGLKVICTDSVTVTADQPNSEPVITAETRTIVQHIGQAAQKSYDYLRAAYDAFVNSRTACVAAATAAGAYAAGYPLAETGAAGGASAGAIAGGAVFDEVTIPAGSALGGLALGGYGAIKGGQVGYALGQAACSSGTGRGGGGGGGGGPKRSPKFRPPTNPPQAPPDPATVPPGWRVRVMPPSAAYPEYPSGYWRLEKPMANGGWQGINPSTMKPGPEWETHVPLP